MHVCNVGKQCLGVMHALLCEVMLCTAMCVYVLYACIDVCSMFVCVTERDVVDCISMWCDVFLRMCVCTICMYVVTCNTFDTNGQNCDVRVYVRF